MKAAEDFRFSSHHLLMELDSATASVLTLVARNNLFGPEWLAALDRQSKAFAAWQSFLAHSQAAGS